MIKPLRKIHVQVWALLAVMIPIGILVSWMAAPKTVTQDLDWAINSMPTLPGPTISVDRTFSSIENENYKLSIRGDSLETFPLLQFETKNDMVTPSLLLFHVIDSTTNDIDKQELIGRIRGNRPHFFSFK